MRIKLSDYMKPEIEKIKSKEIHIGIYKNDVELGKQINKMLKNIYKNKSDLEILIINHMSYFKVKSLENKINNILNGNNQNSFSVNLFQSCNKITVKDSDGSEFDIFSSKDYFSALFLRKYDTNFIISRIIHGKESYPGIINKSYFKHLAES